MKYVIIGNGAAGNAAADVIAQRDENAEVLVLSDEPHPFYYRPLIPGLMESDFDESRLFPASKSNDRNRSGRIRFRTDTTADRIAPEKNEVVLVDGETLSYDRLLIATGGSADIPGGIEGLVGTAGSEGVYTLRTYADAAAVKSWLPGVDRMIVIGGGRIGMKASLEPAGRGVGVTVIEKLDYPIPLQFDRTVGDMIKAAAEKVGIDFRFNRTVARLSRESNRIVGVELDDGERIDAGMVIVATGTRPNTRLAEAAGIRVDNGIRVDRFLRTDFENVYAAGDVVEANDRVDGRPVVSGLWTNAVEMGKIAGANMTGGAFSYPGVFRTLNSFDFAGLPTISIGLIDPERPDEYDIRARTADREYRKLVLKDGVLLGAIFLGNVEGAGVVTGLIKRKIDVSGHVEMLLNGKPSIAPWLSTGN